MPESSPISIYNASAGSGKTYNLVKEYIKILLLSSIQNKHRHLLAITFTNKAVAEMKERILETLRDFASYKKQQEHIPTMLVDIAKETNLDYEVLAKKSHNSLLSILHNYAAFDIVTIDTLTHRILRTFSKDLEISGSFEVSLDVKILLSRAVDRVIDKIGTDQKLTQVLINYALEKADEDKDWNITRDLNNIASLLNQENDARAMESMQDKTLDDFESLSKILSIQKKAINAQIKLKAENLLERFSSLGIEDIHFSRKTFYNHVYKLSKEPKTVKFDPKSKWQNDIENYIFYNKSTDEAAKVKIDSVRDELISFFTDTKSLFYQSQKFSEFQNKVVPLSALQLINKELQKIKEEENILLISDFNSIIHKSLKDQPAAFIYERLGERYTNYFIDEFQDTSFLQWSNLIPLIDNAIVTESKDKTINSLLIVGDPKQAIYRWRGGKAEQFISLASGNIPFHSKKLSIRQLNTNYRSYQEIVSFNNSFFTYLSNVFEKPLYRDIYKRDNNQLSTNKEGGYVSIDFIEAQTNKEADEIYPSRVLKTIQKTIKDGFEKSDICVLVRNNKQGAHIAQYLSEYDIQVVSSDSLLLKNSKTVEFIHNVLLFQLESQDATIAIKLLSFLAEHLSINDTHNFLSSWLDNKELSFHQYLKTYKITFSTSYFNSLPLYEGVEYIIRAFGLINISDAYVTGFLEIIFNYANSYRKGLVGFINYWEEKKDNLSIDAPLQKDAIQIMTIHKSKGLEFPVLIFPYADSDLYPKHNEHHWYEISKEKYAGFSSLMVNHNISLKNYSDQGEKRYKERHSEHQFDNINVLYVALTRSIQRLYILSRFRESIIPKNYSHLFVEYLKASNLWVENCLSYSFGTPQPRQLEKKRLKESTIIPFTSSNKGDHNIKVITNNTMTTVNLERQEAITRGNLIHELLALIHTPSDIDKAVQMFILDGHIIKSEQENYRKVLQQVTKHPQLEKYFAQDMTVYNERSILSKEGSIFIPDRIVVDLKGQTTIIDYKTGIPKEEHKYQIDHYATLLREMNFNVVKKNLVYIENDITVLSL